MSGIVKLDLKVADEVFLVVADLHRRRPEAADFSVSEIMDHQQVLGLTSHLRPGFAIHVRQHCVANLPPNPGNYRILTQTARARRRLFEPGDTVALGREGKIFPDIEDMPAAHRDLVRWAMDRFDSRQRTNSIYERLMALRGSGRGLWREGADQYVASVRQDWS